MARRIKLRHVENRTNAIKNDAEAATNLERLLSSKVAPRVTMRKYYSREQISLMPSAQLDEFAAEYGVLVNAENEEYVCESNDRKNLANRLWALQRPFELHYLKERAKSGKSIYPMYTREALKSARPEDIESICVFYGGIFNEAKYKHDDVYRGHLLNAIIDAQSAYRLSGASSLGRAFALL